jgi:segregation and condensation protein B
MDNLSNIIEAVVFASGKGIKRQEILEKMPDLKEKELDDAIQSLRLKYSKEAGSGIIFFTYGDKLTFASNDIYGQEVTTVLTPLKERELSRSLLEVLSLVAYKQPITRLEIEDIRGVNSDYAISMLSKSNLITVIGRKDAPGRPMLYGTTDDFLVKFELQTLSELPSRKAIMDRIQLIERDKEANQYLYAEVAADIAEDYDQPYNEAEAEEKYPLLEVSEEE